jgi:hypothetical protein
MIRWRVLVAACVVLALVGFVMAEEPPSLLTAQGTVEKVEKDSITVKPRTADGKFGKNLVLKLTGTSRVSTLTPRAQGGKTVMTQKDTDAKDLQPKQTVAVIYSGVGDDLVLLTAVVQPPAGK